MNVFEAITERRSIKKFLKMPVDDNLIGVMLHMATQAPSAGNVQEWNFIVIRDEERKRKLAAAALHQNFIAEAPVVIVVCADMERITLRYKDRGKNLYALQDTANAAMTILLCAQALGLGACWVGAFDDDQVRQVIETPDNIKPLVIIPVGYPAEKPEKDMRIPVENITWIDKYGEKYNIVYATQPGPGGDAFKPLGTMIEETMKKYKKEEKVTKKKLTFAELLRRLAR